MIHFFCALYCEAIPLIQHFKLAQLAQYSAFRLYSSRDKKISLSITGIGKSNAAAAVTYHHLSLGATKHDIWINIGIAGHKTHPIGTTCLANKIIDSANQSAWYPQILFKTTSQHETLLSLDRASRHYQSLLFDMEGSGFYATASAIGITELIHCIKIVSDNTQQPVKKMNKTMVYNLIEKNIVIVDDIITQLKSLRNELDCTNNKPGIYKTMLNKWHFTVTEKYQLQRLLRLWSARFPEIDILQPVKNYTSGKSVLSYIKRNMDNAEFVIDD